MMGYSESAAQAVHDHIQKAYSLFMDRESPDYVGSIRESLTAVQVMSALLTGNPQATVKDAMKTLRRKDKDRMHAGLTSPIIRLLGCTFDVKGIHSSLLDAPGLDFEDAKLILSISIAVINYLFAKAEKERIELMFRWQPLTSPQEET